MENNQIQNIEIDFSQRILPCDNDINNPITPIINQDEYPDFEMMKSKSILNAAKKFKNLSCYGKIPTDQ